MSENEWKLPFNIAIGFHVLLILGVLYLPGLFNAKPKFADIYTVSLISIPEQPVTQPEPAIEEPSVQPIQAPPPVTAKKMAPIAERIAKPTPAPQKAISIKPLKKKKRKKIKENTKEIRTKELERKKRQKLAEALQAEEVAEENARVAQKELERERNLMKTPTQTVSKALVRKKTIAEKKLGGSSNLIQNQYHAAIFGRLHQFWSLPEYMQKDPDLTAVVVITITKNGKIANMFFEDRSGNRMFDQFVAKTIEAASPLPPIPAAMKKQRYEIGLRFKPGSIR
jgi:colicin import membrane protein